MAIQYLMLHKHFHPIIIISLLLLRFDIILAHLFSPLKGEHGRILTAVALEVWVMQKVPHQPDLRDRQAVHEHQLFVEAGVEDLEVRCGRWPHDSKCTEALMKSRLQPNSKQAHAQEYIVDGEEFHFFASEVELQSSMSRHDKSPSTRIRRGQVEESVFKVPQEDIPKGVTLIFQKFVP
ncbi:hypothetical protein DNTS_034058 [Danionella cerebrum]|uniref:Uncharacterized protein n=1 Tax=Danionella cerebrum TaxID=2873325 RepID=A0A553NMF6_9TELE|nr:hypothetical protein DNTS_034058 [Danionella translucida]